MASRIEFEKEWLPKFGLTQPKKDNFKVNNKTSTKTKALNSIKSPGLKNILDTL